MVGILNFLRIFGQMQLDDETKCEQAWISMTLTLQTLFLVTLILNCVSVGLIRIELVHRISKYFYYRPEPDIAIKY